MGVLAQLEIPLVIESLPADLPAVPSVPGGLPPVPRLDVPPLDGEKPSSSSAQNSSPPKKPPAGSIKGRCSPSAKYFLSSSRIEDYLQAALPPQIEKLVKCKGFDLAGLVGSLIATLEGADLLSILDVNSLLDLGGGLGVGSLLGQGGDGEASGLPLLSKATGAVDDMLPTSKNTLSSLLGGENSPVGGVVNDVSLPSLQSPLDDVTKKVDAIKGSAQDAVKEALPPELSNALAGIGMEEMLLGLEVQDVTVDNMKSAMMGDEIQVHAATTATIGGKGIIGPVISILGFKMSMDVTLHIGISTNDTKCINLEIQDKEIKAGKVTLELLEMVNGAVPVSLPLEDLISKVLTVHLQENLEKSASCDIVLSDFNECKNSTGIFKYQIKSAKISPGGLSILYCVEAVLGKTTEPVLGVSLPPDPKDVNSSLTISRVLMNKFIKHVAKESSVKKDNFVANITKVTYSLQQDNTTQATYWVKIKKDGENFAKGKTTVTISTLGKISKNKIQVDIKVTRSEHSVEPAEAKEVVQGVMVELLNTFSSNLKEQFKQFNVPEGVSIASLENANFKLMKTNDLQATK
ncbi:vomeromodulin-like [Thomomys bottae]